MLNLADLTGKDQANLLSTFKHMPGIFNVTSLS